jgi:CHAT domain
MESSPEKINQLGSVLFMQLLGPICQAIPTGNRLIVIPDAMLDYLPFETLVAATKRGAGEVWPVYALEKYSIAYGPSASALLAVGTMNLPESHWDKTCSSLAILYSSNLRSAAATSMPGTLREGPRFDRLATASRRLTIQSEFQLSTTCMRNEDSR